MKLAFEHRACVPCVDNTNVVIFFDTGEYERVPVLAWFVTAIGLASGDIQTDAVPVTLDPISGVWCLEYTEGRGDKTFHFPMAASFDSFKAAQEYAAASYIELDRRATK